MNASIMQPHCGVGKGSVSDMLTCHAAAQVSVLLDGPRGEAVPELTEPGACERPQGGELCHHWGASECGIKLLPRQQPPHQHVPISLDGWPCI